MAKGGGQLGLLYFPGPVTLIIPLSGVIAVCGDSDTIMTSVLSFPTTGMVLTD